MNVATATPAMLTAFAVAVGGQVLYHVAQKQVAPDAHPILAVMAMYVVAFVVCIPLLHFFPVQQDALSAIQGMNWPVVAGGLAIVGIEVGFLLTYRLGASLATTAVVSSAIVAVALFALGVAVFGDAFSWTKAAGGLLCIAGVALISYSSSP